MHLCCCFQGFASSRVPMANRRIVATRVTTSNHMKVNSPVLLTTNLTGSALCSLQWMCEGLAHLGDMSLAGMQD
jgi:hypothetical protein